MMRYMSSSLFHPLLFRVTQMSLNHIHIGSSSLCIQIESLVRKKHGQGAYTIFRLLLKQGCPVETDEVSHFAQEKCTLLYVFSCTSGINYALTFITLLCSCFFYLFTRQHAIQLQTSIHNVYFHLCRLLTGQFQTSKLFMRLYANFGRMNTQSQRFVSETLYMQHFLCIQALSNPILFTTFLSFTEDLLLQSIFQLKK